jgi:cobalt-zinc-cadmium efflux system outer membrane protein
MKARTRLLRRGLLVACLLCTQTLPAAAAETVTLADAVRIAFERNLTIRAADKGVQERKALTRQAAVLPNPEIDAEAENILGSGPYEGTGEADFTLALSQRIEIGGKRAARIKAAKEAEAVSNAERAATERLLQKDVSVAFNRLLAAQEQVRATREAVDAIRRLLPALREKLVRGASSEADLNRGQLALDLAEIRAERSAAQLRTAQQAMLTLWSEPAYRPVEVTGAFAVPREPLPSFAELAARLEDNPFLRAERAKVEHRRAAFDLERAKAVPDPTVSAGTRYFNATDESAFLVSLSIPLTVFDQNRGNIDAAASRISRADLSARISQTELGQELQTAYQAYTSRCGEAERLHRSVVPAAERTSRTIRDGYVRGRFGVLDLLGVTQTEIESEMQAVEAVLACRNAAAEIAGLTGLDLLNTGAATRRQAGE